MFHKQQVFYYRVTPHGYRVFTPPKRAEHIDRLHRAIVESTTWGEPRRCMPVCEYRRPFREEFSCRVRDLPADPDLREPGNDEFSPNDLPRYCDGWNAPWIVREQRQYRLTEVFEKS